MKREENPNVDLCEWRRWPISFLLSKDTIQTCYRRYFTHSKSPSLLLVSNGNSRCSYTCCHHRKLLLILHKLSAFLWDGRNRKANSASNHDWRHYQICLELFTDQPSWVTASKPSPSAGASTSLPPSYCADRNNQSASLKWGKWCYLLLNRKYQQRSCHLSFPYLFPCFTIK